MTEQKKLRKPAETPVTTKGFGREVLADGLNEFRTENINDEKKILSAHIVRETVMSIVRAVRMKNAFESLIIAEAELILQKRNETGGVSTHKKDLKTLEGVVCAALERMELKAEIKAEKRGEGPNGPLTRFRVRGEGFCDQVVVRDSILQESDPVSAAVTALEQYSIGVRKSSRYSQPPPPLSGRRTADKLELTREQLEGRRIFFDGADDVKNHFTFKDQQLEGSFTADQDIVGGKLLRFLDAWIVQQHVQCEKRFSSEIAEAFSEDADVSAGIGIIADGRLRKTGSTIFMLANSFSEELVPEEYLAAVKKVTESPEFYSFRAEGALTEEEVMEYKRAFEEIDHPAHKMARAIVQGIAQGERELTGDEKELLRQTIILHSKDPAGVPPMVLKVIAETYAMISNEDVSAWDEAKRSKNYFRMTYNIRKAVLGLGDV